MTMKNKNKTRFNGKPCLRPDNGDKQRIDSLLDYTGNHRQGVLAALAGFYDKSTRMPKVQKGRPHKYHRQAFVYPGQADAL